MATKFNYANFDFPELANQIYERLKNDPNIHYQGESTILQTVIDIIAAATDMLHYNIERRAEETYLPTARLDSTGILLAKTLGYVPTRNIPARTRIKITIPWNESNETFMKFGLANINNKITLSYFSDYHLEDDDKNLSFSYDDLDFIPNKQLSDQTVAYTTSPLNYGRDMVFYIDLLQAKYVTMAVQNPEITTAKEFLFQEYKIPDTEKFSDFYGENDREANGYTKLWISAAQNGSEVFSPPLNWGNDEQEIIGFYRINRKLINNNILEYINGKFNNPGVKSLIKSCVLKTNTDKTISAVFGDGVYFVQGIYQDMQVNLLYIETEGMIANRSGMIGKELDDRGKIQISTGSRDSELVALSDLDAKIEFETNIYGGINFESLESIKINAPATFAAQDRLVTIQDYRNFLKKHGMSGGPAADILCWGEQEEIDKTNENTDRKIFALRCFANIIMYSVIGRLYDTDNAEHRILFNIDGNDETLQPQTEWTEGTGFYNNSLGGLQWYWLNNSVGTAKSEYLVSIQDYERSLENRRNIMNQKKLFDRTGMITCKHLPMSPIIQYFEIAGKVQLVTTASLNDTKVRINNAIYKFLSTKIGFNTPIYKTDILKIITSFPEVKRVDFDFVPMHGLTGTGFNPSDNISSMSLETLYDRVDGRRFGKGNLTRSQVEELVRQRLLSWFENSKEIKESFINYGDPQQNTNNSRTGVNVFDSFTAITNCTEREYWRTFADDLYKTLGLLGYQSVDENGYVTDLFYAMLQEINLNIKRYILQSMLDLDGNISKFSLNHELAAICMNRTEDSYDMAYSNYSLEYIYIT